MLPPVIVKSLFGEFAARPGARPGTIEIDPAWTASHLETTHLPVLGRVTCNVGIIDQLRDAMRRVDAAGLASTVRSFNGCFVPRHIGWSDENMLSYHSWGIAFDVNLAVNYRGQTPHQDPRLVRILADGGSSGAARGSCPTGTTSSSTGRRREGGPTGSDDCAAKARRSSRPRGARAR